MASCVAGGAGVARRRRRQLRRRHRRRTRHRHGRLRRRIAGERRQIERSARGAAAGRTDRRLIVRVLARARDRRFVAEHARRAGRIRMLRGIEHVGAVAGRGGRRRVDRRRRRHRARGCAGGRSALGAKLLEAILGVVLHALELHLELLVAVLQLLDRAGELAQRAFHAVEADRQIAGIGLRDSRLLRLTAARLGAAATAARRG